MKVISPILTRYYKYFVALIRSCCLLKVLYNSLSIYTNLLSIIFLSLSLQISNPLCSTSHQTLPIFSFSSTTYLSTLHPHLHPPNILTNSLSHTTDPFQPFSINYPNTPPYSQLLFLLLSLPSGSNILGMSRCFSAMSKARLRLCRGSSLESWE